MTRLGRNAVAEILRERVVTGLHVGRFAGGERLPSARSLAKELGVNERVVLAALRSLAEDGLIELRRRSGAYVVPPQQTSGSALPDLGAWLVTVLLQARARGVPPRDLPEYMRRSLETRRVRAACIECNRDQLHLLCSELVNDHGFVTESVELDELKDPSASPALRRVDVLVTTVFHRHDVQVAAEALGKPCIAVGLKPEIMEGVAQRLHDGAVYYVATDERYEEKLRRMLAPMAPIANLRTLLIGRDDVAQIPPNAPTFVMTSARKHMESHFGTAAGRGQPIHPARQFSDAAARELLSFLIRANGAALAAGLPSGGFRAAT
jgi:DNA-binding transcriptional regulator YhcF (GntR family)